MPGTRDPRFEHSVVLICVHSDQGAMGLVLNKPNPELSLSDVLDQLEIPPGNGSNNTTIHIGGPVETGRGFVLHSDEYSSKLKTLAVPGGYGMTATLDILEDIAKGCGPDQALMMLGYAGWGPGQLEAEIGMNGWLTCDSARDLIFETDADRKWCAALHRLGIDPVGLSSTAGRA